MVEALTFSTFLCALPWVPWRLLLYITGLIKHCWKTWGRICAWLFLILMGLKAPTEVFSLRWSQLTLSAGRRKKRKLCYSCAFPEIDPVSTESSCLLDLSFFSSPVLTEVLETQSRSPPFNLIPASYPLRRQMRGKLVVCKHLEKITVSTQPSCSILLQY
jgi:hypothetical protein